MPAFTNSPRGIALALLAATLFALSLVSARISFNSGADPLSVMLIRFMLLAGLLWLWRNYRSSRREIPLRRKLACYAIGLSHFIGIGSYLLSTTYLPVSLAVIIFYTFPILVSISASLLQDTRLNWIQMTALVLAFFGLAIVMDVDISDINVTGLVFACTASIAIAINMLGSARLLKQVPMVDFNFYQTFAVILLCLAGILIKGKLSVPGNAAGWTAFGVMLVTFMIAFLSIYAAIRRVGAVGTSSIMNLEPVMTVLFAILLLNETFASHQLLGGLIVLLGVIIAQKQAYRVSSE